jgi:hypothetical protein
MQNHNHIRWIALDGMVEYSVLSVMVTAEVELGHIRFLAGWNIAPESPKLAGISTHNPVDRFSLGCQ